MATSPLRLLDTPAPRALLDYRPMGLSMEETAALDASGGNSFTNAFRGTVEGTVANAAAAEEAGLRAAGDPQSLYAADNLRAASLEAQRRARAYAPETGSYEDVMEQGITSVPGYVAGQLGQMAGSALDPMAAGVGIGLAGTALGAFKNPIAQAASKGLRYLAAPGVAYKMNADQLTGEAYNTIARDPEAMKRPAQDIYDEVSGHGYRAAILDTAGQLLPMGQLARGLPKMISRLPSAAKLAGGTVVEGLTETGQQISQHYAHEALNPNRDTSGDFSENVNSFLGGAIGGGGMSAIGHMGEKAWNRLAEPGDGKNGDAIPLDGEAPPEVPIRKLESMLGESGSRFKRQSEAKEYMKLLSGLNDYPDDADGSNMVAATNARKDALLKELSARKEPEAAEYAAQLGATDTSTLAGAASGQFNDTMDAASKWLLPKLHLDKSSIMKLKKNAQSVPAGGVGNSLFLGTSFNTDGQITAAVDTRNHPKVGGAFADVDTELLPDGVRQKLGEKKFAAAQEEIELHNQMARLVADKLWNRFRLSRDGDVNGIDREGVVSLTKEITATNTIAKPNDREIRRAKRLGERLAETLGEHTEDFTNEVLRITKGGSELLNQVMWSASSEALVGNSQTLDTKIKERDVAAREMLTLIPPEVEHRLMNAHGIDLGQEQDRHDLMQLIEDFSDGQSNVSLIQLNKLLTAPVVKSLIDHIGQPIKPRLGMGEQMARDTQLGEQKDKSSLSSDDVDASDYEVAGLEKSLDKVTPESMVFHHGRKEITPFDETWNEYDGKDAEGNKMRRLPQLLRAGSMGADKLKDYVHELVTNASLSLGKDRDRYVIGDPTSSDPLVKAGATTAKSMMDKGNIQPGKRAQLFLKYLKQEKHPDADFIAETHRIYSYLSRLEQKAANVVSRRKSLGPYGRKLSMGEAAEIENLKLHFATLGGVEAARDLGIEVPDGTPDSQPMISEEGLEKLHSLFYTKGGAKFIGIAKVLKREKNAAIRAMRELPGFSEYADKVEAETGQTPSFNDYVNKFFEERYAVVAEQPTNKDHLQMDLMTFRKMAAKGKKNMRSAYVAVKDLEYSKELEDSEMRRVVASMNLIRFKSEYSTSENGEVQIPAYMIIDWARKQRDDHEVILEGRKDPDPRGESQSATRQTEDYRRLLLDGITALMRDGLTEGLPWIVNASGGRENFTKATMVTEGGDTSLLFGDAKSYEDYVKNYAGPQKWMLPKETWDAAAKVHNVKHAPVAQKQETGRYENVGYGSLPPSLDLNGITENEFNFNRAVGASARRGDKAEFERTEGPGNKLRGEFRETLKVEARQHLLETGEELEQPEEGTPEYDEAFREWSLEAQSAKDAELSKDEVDVQSRRAIENAENESDSHNRKSKKYEEERRYQKELTGVMRSAADMLPKFLSPGAAVGRAQNIAAGLWRDLLEKAGPKFKGAEERAAESARLHSLALARVVSYAKAADLESYYDDKNRVIGGVHYLWPLAPLLSEQNMALMAKSHPKDIPMLTMMRSKVAGALLGQHEAKKLTTGHMNKLANMLGGYAARAEQERLDTITPPTPEVLAARGNAPKAERISSKNVPKYLAKLAEAYDERTKRLAAKPEAEPKVGTDRSGTLGHNDGRAVGGELDETKRKEAIFLQMLEGIVEDAHTTPDERKKAAKILAKADAREKGVPLAAHTTGSAGGRTAGPKGPADAKGTPTPEALETRQPRELVGPPPESAVAGPKLTLRQRAEAAAKAQAKANAGGLGRSTARAADGSIAASQTEVDADTVDAESRLDKLTAVIDNTLQAAKAKPVEVKSEPVAKVEKTEGTTANPIIGDIWDQKAPKTVPVASGLLTAPPSAPAAYQAKETAKLNGADLVLAPISTQGYAGSLGRAAQAEGKLLVKITPDIAGKTVLVSVPGKGRGFTAMPALIARVMKALDAGATVRTDNKDNAERAWNADGEGALRAALVAGGYVETSGKDFSSWAKGEVAQPAQPKVVQVVQPDHMADIRRTEAEIAQIYKHDLGKDKRANKAHQARIDSLQALLDNWREKMAASINKAYDEKRIASLSDAELKSLYAKLETDLAEDGVHTYDGDGTALSDAIADAFDRVDGEIIRREKETTKTNAPDFPMNYRDGQIAKGMAHHMRPEFKGKDTMDLIISGDRTATTGTLGRFNGAKKGDVVMAKGNGKEALIRFTSDPYPVADMDPQAWSKLEGWAPEVMRQYSNDYQATYELVNKPEAAKPKVTLRDTISANQEYLRNPPEGYTTAKAAEIKTWGEKQIERVRAALKAESDPTSERADDLENMLTDLKQMVKDAAKLVAEDAALEKVFGPQGDTKHNDQATAEAIVNAPAPKSIEVSSAIAHFKRTLGPQVKALLERGFPGMHWQADWNAETLTARISTADPLMIMQLAYHESMHAFFTTILKNHPETRAMLEGVTSDPKMLARLKDMLKDSPEALAAIEKDLEERVAYAYQFWAAGLLDIDTKPETVFQKIQSLFRRVFNTVRDSEKALALFEAFHKGELKEESAAGKAIRKIMNTGEWRARWAARFDKQVQAVYTEVMTSHDSLTSSESKTAQALAKMFYVNPSDPDYDPEHPGMLNMTSMQSNKYQGWLNGILDTFNGPNQKRDFKALVDHMNGSTAEVSSNVAKAAGLIHKLLDHYYEYAKAAGLKMGERQKGAFFPVIWDLDKMVDKREDFVNMLMKEYPHVLVQAKSMVVSGGDAVTLKDVAEAMHDTIIKWDGVGNGKLAVGREDGVLSPYFASENRRNFDWIAPEHRQPFLSEDVVKITSQYFHQGVRAAEYVRAFGVGGENLQDMLAAKGDPLPYGREFEGEDPTYEVDGPIVSELKAEAAKQKITGKKADEWIARRMDDLKRASGALEGTLGKDIKPGMRKFQSAAMTYQAVLRLPLALFSAMLDANGLRVAGGDWDDAIQAYIHGLKNVFLTWKDLMTGAPLSTRGDPLDLKNAMTVGVLAPTMFMEEKGDAFTSEYSTGLSRKINRRFFLANGLTVWDRSMRIMATKAAMKSIANNVRGASPEHSKRWLKELGLTQEGVALDSDGNLIISRDKLAAHYGADMSIEKQRKDIDAELLRVHLAVNRWVQRAIVMPNSALRPTRASDPHYAMFFQFKSFTYAFQKTTMAYALHEAENGNSTAMINLAHGMPIMIAADLMKAMLTGGGSLPGYMANWTIADWVSHAFSRAGGAGISQIGVDALSNPVGAIGGPTLGHVKDLVTGDSLGHELFKSVPIVSRFGGLAEAAKGMADMGN